jgi:hypothetical protein
MQGVPKFKGPHTLEMMVLLLNYYVIAVDALLPHTVTKWNEVKG